MKISRNKDPLALWKGFTFRFADSTYKAEIYQIFNGIVNKMSLFKKNV